jgi:hypothetical protein
MKYCICEKQLKKKGGIAPNRKDYFSLVKQSYEPSAAKKVDNWELVAETPTLKIYRSGNDVVVSIRGTFDSRDVEADATIAVNSLHLSSRFKDDEKFLINFKQQNPNLKYYGVGHSLGGAILDLFLHKGLISEGQSYNPAIQPHDFRATLPNHRIFMSGDPLYTLVKLFLKQKPEVINDNSSIFRKLARLTPIGNVATAGEYLKSHGLEQFEGKGQTSSVPVVGWKQRTKELFNEYMTTEEWRKLFIDNIGNTQRQKVKQRSINSSLFLDIEEELTAEGVNVPDRDELGRYVIALIKDWVNSVSFEVQDPGLPEPHGTGKSKLTLHAVIIKKPFNLNEAKAIARDVMNSKKDKFMRETSTSYRFRNIPKTKFSSFITKKINPNLSLIFGQLK